LNKPILSPAVNTVDSKPSAITPPFTPPFTPAAASATPANDPHSPTVLLAFAVFAAGYFLSYAMRAVNAVISPDLRAELSLSAESMGWLTSAYLITFAALQLPLGVWLDKYGSRRVESLLLLVAAAGCAVFASAHSFTGLVIGRALIGFGVSACLMAAFTSFRQWYEPALMSRLAAWMLVVGTSGALAASVPVRLLADSMGWRTVFVIASAGFVGVSAALWWLFPKQHLTQAAAGAAPVSYKAIFSRQAIMATAPIAFLGQGGFIALQTLWATPWLMQVLGQSAQQAARTLLIMNAVLVGVYILIGTFGNKLTLKTERFFILGSLSTSACGLLLLTLWQSPMSWVMLPIMAAASTGCMMMQARVSVSLPKAISGRGNVALNLVIFLGGFIFQGGIGWAARLIANTLGYTDTQSLAITLAALAIMQLCGVAWLWAHWREARNFDEG
jgi:predicted MFS family arabinose efflux permease